MALLPLLSCCLVATAATRQLRSNEASHRNEVVARQPSNNARTLFVAGWQDDGTFDPEANHDPMTGLDLAAQARQARQMYGPYGHRFNSKKYGSLLERGLPAVSAGPIQPPYSLGQSSGGGDSTGGSWQQRDQDSRKINVYAMTMPPNIAAAVAQNLGFKTNDVSGKAFVPQMPSRENMPFTGFTQQATDFQQPSMFGQQPPMSGSDMEYYNRYLPGGYNSAPDPGMSLASMYGITPAPATPFPEQAVESEEKQMDAIDSMAVPTLAPTQELARAETAPDPAPLPRAEDVLAKMPARPAPAAPHAPARDAVELDTSEGRIVILLRDDAAPKTCAMMRQMVQRGLYDGCVFYRAEPGFVVQGGLRDAAGNARTNPYGTFPFEYKLQNKRATVTMARYTDPNSATGEFFINLNDNRNLDRTGGPGYGQGFEVWGEVVTGMDVAQKISGLPTMMERGMHMLNAPIVIRKASIVKV